MPEITMNYFYDQLTDILNTLEEKEMDHIHEAAEIMYETMRKGGVVQVFGSGHSVGFGMEMTNRAGCLVPIHTMQTSDFVMKGAVSIEEYRSKDVVFERRPGMADKFFSLYGIKEEDCFIIISNSGINGVVIDTAIKAREEGHKVIVLTSWQHTTAEASRHPSGKKLYEMGNVVIDNCGPQGDALIQTDGIAKICSISSITGAIIAQALVDEVCAMYQRDGLEAPVLWSEDVEGYEEHNKELLKKYEGRI